MNDLCAGTIPLVYLCNRVVDSYPDIKHNHMDEKNGYHCEEREYLSCIIIIKFMIHLFLSKHILNECQMLSRCFRYISEEK